MIRFGIVGALATVLDYAVLLLLYRFAHWPNVAAVAGGYIAGLAVCYLLSIRWVFAHRSVRNRGVEFTVFAAIGVVGLILTEIVFELAMRWLHGHYEVSVALHTFIQSWTDKGFAVVPAFASKSIQITLHAARIIAAKSVAIVIVFFFNFWARRTALFTRR